MKEISVGRDYRKIWTKVLRGNISIVGLTGSGKTNTALIIIREAIRLGYAVVVIDTRHTYYNKLVNLFKGKVFYSILHENSFGFYIQDRLTLSQRISVVTFCSQSHAETVLAIAAVLEKISTERESMARTSRALIVMDENPLNAQVQKLTEAKSIISLLCEMSQQKWLSFCLTSQIISDLNSKVWAHCSTHIMHHTLGPTSDLIAALGEDGKKIRAFLLGLEIGEAILSGPSWREPAMWQVPHFEDIVEYEGIIKTIRKQTYMYQRRLLSRIISLIRQKKSLLFYIPDKILSYLPERQLLILVRNSIDAQGNFHDVCYNLTIASQGLISIAVSQPAYYKKKIGNRLSLALKKKERK